ncbi:MAG TPA: isoprenylcysteine carboxylmethyltransferase family protein [Candidatus Limnocylindria bacterium]|nr:isoprenylcysteine carboxylmethyltransferase family protein [Candidatus Limnocylindria bacterium]
MDDRSIRIAVLLAAHVIFLSAAALRIVRRERRHLLRTEAAWWIQYYPPLVWVPFVLAYSQVAWLPSLVPAADLATGVQLAGLAIASGSALFAAWGMWALGRSYGIRLDLFEGHTLKTDGAFALVRHPMYLGIVTFHLGASLALESVALLVLTAVVVVPFTLARIAAEEGVLREAFGPYGEYARRVPALIPIVGAR